MREFLEHTIDNLDLDKSILVHNYKDFKRTEKGQQMIDKYLDRWGKLGFIQGLEGEMRERCAVAMEQLAVYLLTENEGHTNFDVEFETIGFPMIRRIVCGSVDDKLNDLDLFNFEKFIKYCKELDISKFTSDISDIVDGYNGRIDKEAEACAIACEMLIKRFNDDEIGFDERKKEIFKEIKEKIKNKYERNNNE